MTIKTKPSFSITSSIKTILNFMSKESQELWKVTLIEKKSLSTKKSNVFLKKKKIFPSPLKKVPKYSLTSKIKIKSQTTAMFCMISLKVLSFSINKITNHKSSNLCAKKSIRLFKISHFHPSISEKNQFLSKAKIMKPLKLKTL